MGQVLKARLLLKGLWLVQRAEMWSVDMGWGEGDDLTMEKLLSLGFSGALYLV